MHLLRDSRGNEFSAVLRMLKRVEVRTPAGISVGEDWGLDFNDPMINQFIERVGRALLWEEYRIRHFAGHFVWSLNTELPELVYEGLQRFGRIRTVHDVFTYSVYPFKEEQHAWVVANFYGSIEIFMGVSRTVQDRRGG